MGVKTMSGLLSAALVASVALTACGGGGGGGGDKEAIIKSLEDSDSYGELTSDQRSCIEDKLDAYSDDELEDIAADAKADADPDQASASGKQFIGESMQCIFQGGIPDSMKQDILSSFGDALTDSQKDCVMGSFEGLSSDDIQTLMGGGQPQALMEAITTCMTS